MDQVAEITALTQQLSADNLATWSDDKRKSFVDTFDARIRAARYILLKTAAKIASKAKEKHFISDKHMGKLEAQLNTEYSNLDLYDKGQDRYSNNKLIGGRPASELNDIANDRANEIIEVMPALSDAVRIISPEVSTMIDKRAKLLAKGKELFEQSQSLTGGIDMDDLDQTMSIAAFKELVEEREKQRLAVIAKLDQIGKDGRLLDSKINKFLYDGLPGLSDAVLKVVQDYIDRTAGFAALNRRVGEQVQFGDSEAAMEMLKSFEKDEVKISSDVKAQFDAALDLLKLAAKKGLKSGARSKNLLTAPRKG